MIRCKRLLWIAFVSTLLLHHYRFLTSTSCPWRNHHIFLQKNNELCLRAGQCGNQQEKTSLACSTYDTNCVYESALHAWANFLYKRTACPSPGAGPCSLSSSGIFFNETTSPARRLNQWNIAGSVVVVVHVYCVPSPACLGCLINFFPFSSFSLSLYLSVLSPLPLFIEIRFTRL